MNKNYSRRGFVTTAAGLALGTMLARTSQVSAAEPNPNKSSAGAPSLNLGVAGYSMREFSIEETLFWLNRWQLRFWSIKDVHLPLDSSPEVIASVKARSEAAGVTIYGAGVIYMKTEKDVADAFAYAKRLGARIIIGAPNAELLPHIEKSVQDSGIRLAIHNHGPDMDLFPTPESIYVKIKNLDPGIGICLDVGHTQRSGIDPSDALEEFSGRIFDIHLKDVDKAAKDGKTVPIGRGIIDIHRLVNTIGKVKFNGVCGLEYEGSKNVTLPGIAESLGYLRGVLSNG